jgi:3-deoxy-D-manno-octulosonic-acid transferase
MESLWMLMEKAVERGHRLVVTAFSRSAFRHLERVLKDPKIGAQVLAAGYSPLEGGWRSEIERLKPDLFLTAKYEAWPEAWMSLSEAGVPLMILGARVRSSLTWARRICSWMGASLPDLHFSGRNARDLEALREEFPGQPVYNEADPRWDRVAARVGKSHPRVEELREKFRVLPKPWWILGSAYVEDVKLWEEATQENLLSGTWWVVPHHVGAHSLDRMAHALREAGKYPIRSTGALEPRASDANAVLVDEMGFLAELYRLGDAAYVGGGFGPGIHSTIEPALAGLAVACGPVGSDRFEEVEELREVAQLSVVRSASELGEWLRAQAQVESAAHRVERELWGDLHQRLLGASDRLMDRIEREILTKQGRRV